MGTTDSKEKYQDVKQIGDQQVTVIENQEVHTGYHEQHEWKLLLIMIAVSILLMFKILKLMWKMDYHDDDKMMSSSTDTNYER